MFYSYYHCKADNPIGRLRMVGNECGLNRLDFMGTCEEFPLQTDWEENSTHFNELISQLDAYFAGKLINFELDLNASGTPFQLEVLTALRTIPYGHTQSYGDIAHRINRPKAVRAVGAANGRNPIPIIIPCHRVIGSDGSLTGFGGGLEVKRFLLELESTHL